MSDLISRQAAIDALRMDIDIIPYAKAREYARAVIETVYNRLEHLPTAQPQRRVNAESTQKCVGSTQDCVSRQEAIDALWKALFEYEDKTEKQFQESEELGVGDWFAHRIFVQNMNDIDRQTILNLPAAQPPLDEWCDDCKEYDSEKHCCPR